MNTDIKFWVKRQTSWIKNKLIFIIKNYKIVKLKSHTLRFCNKARNMLHFTYIQLTYT